MKVKTILAMLLLAAVMMTPSYGADQDFINGAKLFLSRENHTVDEFINNPAPEWTEPNITFSAMEEAFFMGYVKAVTGELNSNGVSLPMGVYYRAVATYVVSHPHEHFEHTTTLVVRAFKQSFPSRCPDHFWSSN